MARTPRRSLNDIYGDLTYFSGNPVDEIDHKLIECAQALGAVIDEFINKGWCSSLREFALAVGVPHSSIIRILNGTTLPDIETVAKIEVITERPIWSKQNRTRPDVMPKIFKSHMRDIRDQKGAKGLSVRMIDLAHNERGRKQELEMKRRKRR